MRAGASRKSRSADNAAPSCAISFASVAHSHATPAKTRARVRALSSLHPDRIGRMEALEEFDIRSILHIGLVGRSAAEVARPKASLVGAAQRELPRAPGDRPILDAARGRATQIAADDGDALIGQKALRKSRIFRADA